MRNSHCLDVEDTMSEVSTTDESMAVAETEGPRPVIDLYWTGVFTIEEVRFKTPGITMPSELIGWFRTYGGVKQLAVGDDEQLGQTDFVHFTWTEGDSGMFGSVIIEMICAYFGWNRTDVVFTGDEWTEEADEMAYARRVLATLPQPSERVLVLRPGLRYVVQGVEVTMTTHDNGDTILQAI